MDKGFTQSNNDHQYFHLYIDGKKSHFFVKISHATGELRRDEIRNNARQMRTRGDDLYKILSCEHDKNRTLQVAREAQAAQLGAHGQKP